MTEGVELRLFTTYQGFDIMDTVEAAQLTKETFIALRELTGAMEAEFVDKEERPTDGEWYLWLPNDPNGEHVAVIGDYIMQDLAGHYLIIPQKLFEKRYAKRI